VAIRAARLPVGRVTTDDISVSTSTQFNFFDFRQLLRRRLNIQ
jgi:hypothetical protein